MLKKRLIFILFFQDGFFHLSRNFNLQRVGNASWLVDKFKFNSIGDYIDELIILDVSRGRENKENISLLRDAVEQVMKGIFVPLSLGGGITSLSNAKDFFEMGADKIILNSSMQLNPGLVCELVNKYGAQAVVGSIDYKKDGDECFSYINNGQTKSINLYDAISNSERLGVGEIMINSIDRDGTGMGFEFSIIDKFPEVDMPIIISGGAGKPVHFLDAFKKSNISAVGTGNLLILLVMALKSQGYLLAKILI